MDTSKLKFKAEIMDENAMKRALRRIAHEIIENNGGVENLKLVGIQRRGVTLAKMIRETTDQKKIRKMIRRMKKTRRIIRTKRNFRRKM